MLIELSIFADADVASRERKEKKKKDEESHPAEDIQTKSDEIF